MKLTKKSKQFISFFTKHNYINPLNQTKKTDSIILEFYQNILESHFFLSNFKKVNGKYNPTFKKVNGSQISKPLFHFNGIPEIVRNQIHRFAVYEISYSFSLFERNIQILFVVEEPEPNIEIYNKYIDSIIMWLYILNLYASKSCVNNLVIYLYFTSLEKKLPDSNNHTLDGSNINTAFTTTCPKDSEIVVYRKEEWFKVFIHESFHNFGLDFSGMNTHECNKHILNIFKLHSAVNLYEAYTEFWGEIVNALFCSFFALKNKNNWEEFLSNSEYFIHLERTFSFFQLVKILKFMGLTYSDLYVKNNQSNILSETMYKEKTNVFAYYVIKTILLNNYQSFLGWCKNKNPSLIQFKQTLQNQKEFCLFIESNYKSRSMLENIAKTEQLFQTIHTNNNGLLSNLRMTICELD